MIDGEAGPAILSTVAALQMDALMGEGDSITTTMIGACIADALRKGETPRDVAQGLLDGLPTDRQWETMRGRVTEALEQLEERTEPT